MSEKSLIEQIEEESRAKREADRKAREEVERRNQQEAARRLEEDEARRRAEAERRQQEAATRAQQPSSWGVLTGSQPMPSERRTSPPQPGPQSHPQPQQPPPQYYAPPPTQYVAPPPQAPPQRPPASTPQPVQQQPPPYYPPTPQNPPASGQISSPPALASTRPPATQKVKTGATPAGTKAAPPKPASLSKDSIAFLKMDAHEGFDLDALNELDFVTITAEATASPARAQKALDKCEVLLGRACQDLGDPTIIDDIVRDKVMIWVRRSLDDATWLATMPSRWAGVFHESRAAGGRMRQGLITRLEALRAECSTVAPKEEKKPARGLFGRVFSSKEVEAPKEPVPFCPPSNPLMLQTAQAFLDDLATSRRKETQSCPLVRVSEIAQRGGMVGVNKVFAELFASEERGPFIVLHPARNPEFDLVAVRPPPPNAPKVAIVYDLVNVKAPTQTTQPDAAALIGAVASPAPMGILLGTTQVMTLGGGPAPEAATADFSAAIWDRKDMSKAEWKQAIDTARSQRGRLEPPPLDYRKRQSFFQLRELIVDDRQAARPFLSVKWRGKPTGIIVLAQLLADKTVMPDAETDCEYLEAELGDIERGNTEYRPPNGQWIIGGNVKIVREAKDGMLAYKAEPAS